MMALNRVMVAGNLTRDPNVRQTPSGMPVGTFGLALNERYTTKEGKEHEEVCFVDVEVWGKQAETCSQYLAKGSPAFVEGRLHCDRWEDRETGKPRNRLLVRADRVQFLTSPNRAQESPADRRAAVSAGPERQTNTTPRRAPREGGQVKRA